MGRAEQIVEGIWWVGCGSWGRRTEVLSAEGSGNVFLTGGGDDYALIDAGTPEGAAAILENATGAGARPGDIRRIVLTHSHGDHVLAAPELKKATGARIAASKLAAKALAGDKETRKMLFVRHDVTFEVDEVLADGDEISLGGYRFEVISTPGHIPCSITLTGEVAGRKVIFTGDTAIGDQYGMKGVVGWLNGLWGANPKHLLKSIERISQCRADLMLPGHGRPIEGRENVRTSLQHCAHRLNQLLAIPDLASMMPIDMKD